MEQMTREEAIAFYDSDEWHDFTDEQIFLLQINQECVCVPWSSFLEATNSALGRPVWPHELLDGQRLIDELTGIRPRPSMDEIIQALEERIGKVILFNADTPGS